MGLDIGVYTNLKKLDIRTFDEDGEPIDPNTGEVLNGDYLVITKNPYFEPGRADEFEDGAVYEYDDYESFRAGSYSGYSQWRTQLAKIAGYNNPKEAWKEKEGPFWELINFSDCEGVLGTSVCKKLAKDFINYQPIAELEDEYFRQKYIEWKEAVETAAENNGAIDFH